VVEEGDDDATDLAEPSIEFVINAAVTARTATTKTELRFAFLESRSIRSSATGASPH
jgi:hypothetical protein